MFKPAVHMREPRLGAAEGHACAHRHTCVIYGPDSLVSTVFTSPERRSDPGHARISQQERCTEHTGGSNPHSDLTRCDRHLTFLSSLISRQQINKENPGKAKHWERC